MKGVRGGLEGEPTARSRGKTELYTRLTDSLNFTCSFAHERCEYAEKSASLLHLQPPMRDAFPPRMLPPPCIHPRQ